MGSLLAERMKEFGITPDIKLSESGTIVPKIDPIKQAEIGVQSAISGQFEPTPRVSAPVTEQSPVYGPELPPPPKPFKVNVPTTMDSRVVAQAYSEPSEISPSTQQLMKEAENMRLYGSPIAPTDVQPVEPSKPKTTTEETTVPPPSGMTAEQLTALFPKSESLASYYETARTKYGLPQIEAKAATVNQKLAEMSATIDNIESDVRAQIGGEADASTIAAVIADRTRRLLPEYNRLQREASAYQNQLTNLNNTVLNAVGLTKADIEATTSRRDAIRNGINQMIDFYGSNAFSDLPKEMVMQLEQEAGYLPGTLGRGVKTIAERQIEMSETAQNKQTPQIVNGRLFSFDPLTGEFKDSGIEVPDEEKDNLATYVEIAKSTDDPLAGMDFIKAMMGQSPPGAIPGSAALIVPSNAKISELNDEQKTALIKAMAKREGFGAPDPNNRPNRNNNPLDIKYGSATKHWVDEGKATVDPIPATDGGKFLKFNDVSTGLQAADELLSSKIYSGLDLDSAMKKWSGNGYGAEVLDTVITPTVNPFKKKEDKTGEYTDQQWRLYNTINDNFRQNKTVQNYETVRNAWRGIISGAKANNGPGDVMLITSFVRVTDPGVSVRVEEYKTAAEAIPLAERLINIPQKLIKGTQLTPEGRKFFVTAATENYKKYLKDYEQVKTKAVEHLTKGGLSEEDLMSPSADYGD